MRRDEFGRVAMPHTESLLRAALRITRDGAAVVKQNRLLFSLSRKKRPKKLLAEIQYLY